MLHEAALWGLSLPWGDVNSSGMSVHRDIQKQLHYLTVYMHLGASVNGHFGEFCSATALGDVCCQRICTQTAFLSSRALHPLGNKHMTKHQAPAQMLLCRQPYNDLSYSLCCPCAWWPCGEALCQGSHEH